MKSNEIWEDIKGYEGYYQINEFGVVRSLDRCVRYRHGHRIKRGNVCKPFVRNRYLAVALCKQNKVKQFSLHRLLAITFIPNPTNKPTVNHKDGDKLNNSLCNLEWATHSEQIYHAVKTGLFKPIPPTKKGDVLSAKTKQKMSKARKGRKHSIETKTKISNRHSRKVICIEDNSIFKSMNEASIFSGVPKTTFSRKMNLGKPINGKKYEWYNTQQHEGK